ncbi:hypothetical protein EXIGLDRAFT_839785 [Exidia glandulosa HHB12029]|uniref:F-box domain-containing protein n=1 Tax=Exidia glandulosa HHB12029 TaxID=1314781 RepID=A0A165EU13_EXIGL|nr:hypothetical protein EXIGLDRAFT_839785 [Exidia glandulosa HHB12029]
MTLSTKQRDALYAYVSSLLTESVNDTRDPSVVDASVSDIASVTRKAMCDVMETWNREACGVMCRLPTELLAQSFSGLDPLERVKVTAVSRYFRSVTLKDPSFWAKIKFEKKHRRRKGVLELLLERSGRALLDVDIYALDPWVEDFLLAKQFSRIRTIVLQRPYTTLWIFEQAAPVLEVLEVPYIKDGGGTLEEEGRHKVLPPPSWAPLLRRLELPGTFVLSRPSDRFHRVTYFAGYMTAKGTFTDARALFEVFPSLEILKLSFIGSASVHNMPNTRIPSTLMELILSDTEDNSNIASSLELWHGHPFRVVTLQCPSAAARLIIPILEHMRSVTARLWHINLGDRRAVLRTEHGAVYVIECARTRQIFDTQTFDDLRSSFDSLHSIVLTPEALSSQLIDVFDMPSLHSITLRGSFLRTSALAVDCGTLCVPRLHTLRLEPEEYDDEGRFSRLEMQQLLSQYCSQYAKELVRRLTLEDGSALSRIPRLVFSKVTRPYVREEYWAWIYRRTSSVYIENELLWQEETDN